MITSKASLLQCYHGIFINKQSNVHYKTQVCMEIIKVKKDAVNNTCYPIIYMYIPLHAISQ